MRIVKSGDKACCELKAFDNETGRVKLYDHEWMVEFETSIQDIQHIDTFRDFTNAITHFDVNKCINLMMLCKQQDPIGMLRFQGGQGELHHSFLATNGDNTAEILIFVTYDEDSKTLSLEEPEAGVDLAKIGVPHVAKQHYENVKPALLAMLSQYALHCNFKATVK